MFLYKTPHCVQACSIWFKRENAKICSSIKWTDEDLKWCLILSLSRYCWLSFPLTNWLTDTFLKIEQLGMYGTMLASFPPLKFRLKVIKFVKVSLVFVINTRLPRCRQSELFCPPNGCRLISPPSSNLPTRKRYNIATSSFSLKAKLATS